MRKINIDPVARESIMKRYALVPQSLGL